MTQGFPAHARLALAGIFACEIGATLLVAVAGRPGFGLSCVGLGMVLALRWARAYRRHADLAAVAQIASARALLAEGRRTEAWNLACAAADAVAGGKLRNAALRVMAEVAIGDRACDTAREILTRMLEPIDPLLEAEIAHAEGRSALAVAVLERARARRSFDPAAARRLVELHAEAGDLDRAVTIALEHLPLLGAQDLRNMIASLEAWGSPDLAGRLEFALGARPPSEGRDVVLARAPEAGG
jgi:hypothetical protein